MDSFTTSDLARQDGTDEVYSLVADDDTGTKHWVNLTATQFVDEAGADADSIYTINDTDNGSYTTGGAYTVVQNFIDRTPPAAATEGDLTISLSAGTPASANVADGANANFTKVILTAGSTAVSISKLYVTRTGYSVNSDLENIKLVDMDGIARGSVGSLNTNDKALITFAPALAISANTSAEYYIRAGFVDGKTASIAALGIDSADDIVTSGDVTVSGSFPITGNQMSLVVLAIGTATFSEDGTTVDSQPDVGDENVVVNKFKVEAGSVEGITVEQITALETGTAALTDIANIELYSVTESRSLGEVESWSAEGKASWANLDIVVDKGNTHRFEIRVDIIGGSSLTSNADLEDGTDMLASVKGNTYGFYITPTHSGDGKGSNDQTIQAGALNVSKSSATPATGNIAAGDNVELVVFDFTATGEEVRISALHLDFDLGTMTYDQVTNVKIYDENNDIVAGPKDVVVTTTDIDFTDVFVVPVGTHQYTVKAKIANAVSSSDTIECGIDTVGADITAKGMSSNESITATPATDVEGNTLTVAAGSLSATTLTQPVARSLAKGTTDFVWMTASLDAGSSGEDVNVTALVIEDTLGDAGDDAGTIDNCEIWADLDETDSDRGDAYETLVSATKQFADSAAADETLTFALSQTITVSKTSYVKIAFVADLAAGATTGDTHTISLDTDAADVTATGATTGNTVSVTPTGAGQTMTVAASGTLTVTVDSSSPSADLLLDSQLTSVGVFRLAANNVEDLDLDEITLTDDGSDDGVDTYYLYSNSRADEGSTSDPIKTVSGGAAVTAYITDGTVTVPADDYVLITVKALMNNVDGTAVVNGDTLEVTISAAGDVDTTGLSSGTAVDSTDTDVDAATHSLYENYPSFAFATDSPSGTLSLGANTLIGKVEVTASAGKDITFQNADGNDIMVQVQVVGDDTDTATETVTFKDDEGNTLDTGTMSSATATNELNVDFSTNDWTIAAGTTEVMYIYADTTDFEDTGDTIQVWFDDTTTDIDFGVDGANFTNEEGAKIFKGDIFGGTLVKPGS